MMKIDGIDSTKKADAAIILVQYFPLNRTIGGYAESRLDCWEFNEKFREQVHASDLEHWSIIMYLNKDDFDKITPVTIRQKCIELLNQNDYKKEF